MKNKTQENRVVQLKEGFNINVYLDGKLYESFHEISDGYAHTNARKCVNRLKEKIGMGNL